MINTHTLPAFTKQVITEQLQKGADKGYDNPEWDDSNVTDESLHTVLESKLEQGDFNSALCYMAMLAARKYNAELKQSRNSM